MADDYESLYRQGIKEQIDQLRSEVRMAIARFDQHNNDLTKELNDLRVQVGVLETTVRSKAGIWGGVIGALTSLAGVLMFLLSRLIPR